MWLASPVYSGSSIPHSLILTCWSILIMLYQHLFPTPLQTHPLCDSVLPLPLKLKYSSMASSSTGELFLLKTTCLSIATDTHLQETTMIVLQLVLNAWVRSLIGSMKCCLVLLLQQEKAGTLSTSVSLFSDSFWLVSIVFYPFGGLWPAVLLCSLTMEREEVKLNSALFCPPHIS